jgi:lipoate-protein ligase A
LKNLNAVRVLEQYEIITQGIISGLNIFGIKTKPGQIHCPALFFNGKKFSGNAQVRNKGHLLQHGTILLEIDPELMYSVLKTPPNVSKSRMVRSVKAKCIGIKENLENFNEKSFIDALKQGFEKKLRIKLSEGKFSRFELDLAKRLVEEKYKSDSWLKLYE